MKNFNAIVAIGLAFTVFSGCGVLRGMLTPPKVKNEINTFVKHVGTIEKQLADVKTDQKKVEKLSGNFVYMLRLADRDYRSERFKAARERLYNLTVSYVDRFAGTYERQMKGWSDKTDGTFCRAPDRRPEAWKGCLFEFNPLCSRLSQITVNKRFMSAKGAEIKKRATAFNSLDTKLRDTCFEKSLAKAELPVNNYKGADRNRLKRMILKTWKFQYPKDKVVKVVFQTGAWERKQWKSIEGNRIVYHDMSYLSVYVFVPLNDRLARGYVAVVNRNNIAKTLSVGAGKRNNYVPVDALIKRLL